ncbi:hypothetical protein acdb102_34700 [Acidothermaceae bacterium B102]|nr:hypothetical protein acdb102_34700 [Acidothermaceae bacterium B102]
MLTRRRVAGALLALILPVTAAVGPVTTAAADAPAAAAVPPACATADPSQDCVHAATPDIVALPSPTFTTTYDAKKRIRTVVVNAAITPAYHACPPGAYVPYAALPCAQPGLTMTERVYNPGEPVSGAAGTPVGGVTCDFSCPMTFTLFADYYGPATLILKFSVGDVLATPGNDLYISSYESTITLPADPFVGAFHVTKPSVAFAGKMKSTTVVLGGHGQIPKGAGGVVVLAYSKGEAKLHGGQTFGNGYASLLLIPGTSFKMTKLFPGATTVTTVGWYSKGLGTTGDLIHTQYVNSRLHIGKTLALHSVGVPLDATGALLEVTTPNGPTKVGGVLVPASQFAELVLVPATAGAKVTVKAAKGAVIAVHGWTEPLHPVDEGLALTAKVPVTFPY